MLFLDQGHLQFRDLPKLVVQTKIPVALFQILVRLLQAQTVEGSWGSCEETAYALLALTTLASLPFASIMHTTIQKALDLGREFLLDNACLTPPDSKDRVCLWIDKVRYRIPHVSYSYILAALRASSASVPESTVNFIGRLAGLISIPTERIQSLLRFYRKMPLFCDCKDWQLLAYISEGYLYVPILDDVRRSVFGREGMGKDQYTEYIPFSWTSANAMHKKYSSPQNCFVLMTISLVNVRCPCFFVSLQKRR
jgi:hypothetical protein